MEGERFWNLCLLEQLGHPRKLRQSIVTLLGSTNTGGPMKDSPTAQELLDSTRTLLLQLVPLVVPLFSHHLNQLQQ